MSDADADAARGRWLDVLRALGTTEEELAEAETPEELLLLVIERGLSAAAPVHEEEEAAELAGLEVDATRRLYRALGVPDPHPGEAVLNTTTWTRCAGSPSCCTTACSPTTCCSS